jgi:hypothetical protein
MTTAADNNHDIFTYLNLNNLGITPCTLEAVYESYPYPPRDGIPYAYFAHYPLDKKYLNPVFLNIMDVGGLSLSHSEVFFRPGTGEDFDAFIHVDGYDLQLVTKFNWIVGDRGNTMQWYMPNVKISEKHQLMTKVDTKYLVFDSNEVDLIDEVDLHGLYVVNAGIPHGVKMISGTSKTPRIAVSIVPRLKSNDTISPGGRDAYLRMLFGAYELGIIDRELWYSEFYKATGKRPLKLANWING